MPKSVPVPLADREERARRREGIRNGTVPAPQQAKVRETAEGPGHEQATSIQEVHALYASPHTFTMVLLRLYRSFLSVLRAAFYPLVAAIENSRFSFLSKVTICVMLFISGHMILLWNLSKQGCSLPDIIAGAGYTTWQRSRYLHIAWASTWVCEGNVDTARADASSPSDDKLVLYFADFIGVDIWPALINLGNSNGYLEVLSREDYGVVSGLLECVSRGYVQACPRHFVSNSSSSPAAQESSFVSSHDSSLSTVLQQLLLKLLLYATESESFPDTARALQWGVTLDTEGILKMMGNRSGYWRGPAKNFIAMYTGFFRNMHHSVSQWEHDSEDWQKAAYDRQWAFLQLRGASVEATAYLVHTLLTCPTLASSPQHEDLSMMTMTAERAAVLEEWIQDKRRLGRDTPYEKQLEHRCTLPLTLHSPEFIEHISVKLVRDTVTSDLKEDFARAWMQLRGDISRLIGWFEDEDEERMWEAKREVGWRNISIQPHVDALQNFLEIAQSW